MSAAGAPLTPFAPDRAWWGRLLAVIDARDADGFVAFLTPDAEFRFGNAPAVHGREAICNASDDRKQTYLLVRCS